MRANSEPCPGLLTPPTPPPPQPSNPLRPSEGRSCTPLDKARPHGWEDASWHGAHPPTRSHEGSQGVKSPHLHPPQQPLFTGLAEAIRQAGAVPEPPARQQMGSNRERNGPRWWIAATMKQSSATGLPDLPITSRTKPSNWTRQEPSWLLRYGTDFIQCRPVRPGRSAWVARQVAK